MKGPTHNRFHFLAIGFLRDRMDVQTDTLPSNEVASPDDPEHARFDGHVFPEGYRSRLGYVALMLLLFAGTIGMASLRPGLGAALELGLQAATLLATVVSAVLLIVELVQRRRLARRIEMVIQGGAADTAAIDTAQLERWHAQTRGQLWVVAERGFTAAALELAHAHGTRCFARTNGAFAEVHATTAASVGLREAA